MLVTPYKFTASTFTVGVGYGTSFNTDSGRTYLVEYKNYLTNATWTTLTNVLGNGSAAVIADPGATGPERYYRISTLFP